MNTLKTTVLLASLTGLLVLVGCVPGILTGVIDLGVADVLARVRF